MRADDGDGATEFRQLVERVQKGGVVLVSHGGTPIGRLVAVPEPDRHEADRGLIEHMHGVCGQYHTHFSTVRTASTALIAPLGLTASVLLLDTGRAAALGWFPYFFFGFVGVLVLVLNVIFAAFSKRCRTIERYLEGELRAGLRFDPSKHGFRHLFRSADAIPDQGPWPHWWSPAAWWKDVFMWAALVGVVLYWLLFIWAYGCIHTQWPSSLFSSSLCSIVTTTEQGEAGEPPRTATNGEPATRLVRSGEGEGKPVGKGARGQPVGPFDQQRRLVEHVLQAQLRHLVGAVQAVEVDVQHGEVREVVALHQGEGRARHLDRGAGEGLDAGPGQGRLAGAQITLQRHHVARPQEAGQADPEGGGGRSTAQDEGVSRSGHGEEAGGFWPPATPENWAQAWPAPGGQGGPSSPPCSSLLGHQ